MTAASNYFENILIDRIFRNQSYAFPTTLYVGLYLQSGGSPGDAAGGTEVTGGSYARKDVACSLTEWKSTQGDNNVSSGTSGTTSNTNTITFATPTADWGTIGYFGIFNQSSGGNLLFWGALSSAKAVFNGDAVSIQPGQLQIQMDD